MRIFFFSPDGATYKRGVGERLCVGICRVFENAQPMDGRPCSKAGARGHGEPLSAVPQEGARSHNLPQPAAPRPSPTKGPPSSKATNPKAEAGPRSTRGWGELPSLLPELRGLARPGDAPGDEIFLEQNKEGIALTWGTTRCSRRAPARAET